MQIDSLVEQSNNNIKVINKIKTKNYISWIDIMRGIGIIIIIFHHVGLNVFLGSGALSYEFYDNILYYSVIPVFIFLSGYTMYINYNEISNYKTYFKKKFKYIIPNYLIWGIPTCFFFLLFTLSSNLDFISLLITTVLSVLTGNIWIIYFIYVIIQLYIIYPLILKIINRIKKPFIYFIIYILLLLIIFIISIYLIDVASLSKLALKIPLNQQANLNLYILRYTPISVTYLEYLSIFIFGILCAKYKSNISNLKHHKAIIVLLVPIFILLYFTVSGYHVNPVMWTSSSQPVKIYPKFEEYFGCFLNIIAQLIYLFMIYSFFSKIKFSSNTIEKENIERRKVNEKSIKLKFKRLNNKIKLILWKVGIYSAGIYYMHFFTLYFFLSIQNLILSKLIPNLYILFLIRFFGLLFLIAISYLLVNYLSKNIKRSRYIIGV